MFLFPKNIPEKFVASLVFNLDNSNDVRPSQYPNI